MGKKTESTSPIGEFFRICIKAFRAVLFAASHMSWVPFAMLQFALLYPWIYTAFDRALCHRHGSLAPMKLRCECPESRTGLQCETCIPEVQGRGSCSGKHVICYDKWAGPTCDFCPAQNPSGTNICTGPCVNALNWYDDAQTGRCTFCNSESSCSGHGQCLPSGVCNCSEGYAGVGSLSLAGVSDCGLQCPNITDGITCNGHGTCVPGGLCQCTGPWCGVDCTSKTSDETTCKNSATNRCDVNKPCGGNGYPVQVYDEKTNTGSKACLCECKLDRDGNAQFLGEYCQYECPVGRGGIVCGGDNFTAKMNADNTACMCECSKGGQLRERPCESDCFYGGVESTDGLCTCTGVHALTPCDICEPGYWIPELGCSERCVNGVTCQSGICGRSNHDSLVVQCNGCDGYRNPVISTIVQSTDVLSPLQAMAKITIEFGQVFLVSGETRELVLTPGTSTLPSVKPATLEIIEKKPVLTLASNANATLKLDAQATAYNYNPIDPMPLQGRMMHPLTGDSKFYVKLHQALYHRNGTLVTDFSSINSSVATACMELNDCVGYSNNNGGELYSEFCTEDASSGCSTRLAATDSTAIVDKVKLSKFVTYAAKVVDTLRRGCYACLEDYYPHPSATVLGDDACKNHCNRETTCNKHGHCSDAGQCICDYPNMGPHCHNCTEGFYPAPDVGRNGTMPCSVQCEPNAFPDPTRDINACSGHGYCNPADGQCVCADSEKTHKKNGWSGIPPGSACNIACAVGNNTNATSVCSNNGQCVNNVCMCHDGYFGAHCQVTCNRDDQYFWVRKNTLSPYGCNPSARGHGCDTGLPCGVNGSSTCTRLTCNGGACVRRHQYEHVYDEHTFASRYYEPCNVSDAGPYPLRECTALTKTQYDALANSSKVKNDTKAYIEQTMGIYCDVNSDPTGENVPKWQTTHGLCARVLCNCAGRREHMRRSAVSSVEATGTIPDTFNLPTGMPTAGPGCQYTGCQEAEFGTEGSKYQSMCGSLPPTALPDDNPLGVVYGSPTQGVGLNALKVYLGTNVEHFCSHGECVPHNTSNPAYALGTRINPVPANAESAPGTCKCKATPQVSTMCTGDNINAFDWPKKCCSGYYDKDATSETLPWRPLKRTSPFYGVSCAAQCSCANEQYDRGTCRLPNTGSTASMGLECTCRQGYRGKNTTVPVPLTSYTNTSNTLWCGPRCRYQCMGVINLDTNTLTGTALSGHCPSNLALDNTPALQKGCYRNVVPCWGHGTCVGASQNCRLTRTVNSQAVCACWGSDVNIANTDNNGVLTNQILLPPVVTLFGGDDCQYQCPGVYDAPAGQLSAVAYFTDHRAKLENPHPKKTDRDVLEKFVQIYSTYVCSGHGYCQHGSPVVNRTLQCTCTGDWGGPKCDQRCTLPAYFWTNWTTENGTLTNPLQDMNASAAIEDALGEEFGLDLCGPHACCGCDGSFDKKCDQDVRHYKHGSYKPISRWPVPSFPPITTITDYLSSLVPGATELDDFIGQWALAFVGPFSTCANGHFSNVGVDNSKGLHDELLGLPALVRWHRTRSCDAVYAQNAWQDFTPWCCSLEPDAPSGAFFAWQDEAFARIGGHGGCPDGHCPTFATGRMCKHCVNDDFTNYLPVGASKLCSNVEQNGYCNQCRKSGTYQRIAPYTQPNTTHWPNKCVRCMSSPLRKSGNQAYFNNPHNLVCNPVGIGLAPSTSSTNGCIGNTLMYSTRDQKNAFAASNGTSLLLGGPGTASVQNRLQLGLCKCSADWNGPTCSMPLTQKACSNNGIPKALGSQAFFKYANEGEIYYRCDCDSGYHGIYCEFHSSHPDMYDFGEFDLEAYSDVACDAINGCFIQECNGHGVKGPGGCECNDAQLDPHSSCREYKARGPNGVRTLHQLDLLADLEPLPNHGGAEYNAMLSYLQAEQSDASLS